MFKFIVPKKKILSLTKPKINHVQNLFNPCKKKEEKGAFDDKIIIVTGGANGMGLEIVSMLLFNCVKAVIIADKDEESACMHVKEFNTTWGKERVFFQKCDISKKKEFEQVFQFTKKKFGKISVLINNAGIWSSSKWEDIICTNMFGLVFGTHLGMQYMPEGGDILNLIHIDAIGPRFIFPVASGSQGFQLGFTKAMGHEDYSKADKGKIKIMGIITGLTDTNLTNDAKKIAESSDMKQMANCNTEAEKIVDEPWQTTTDVASCVVEALLRGKHGDIYLSNRRICQIFKYDMSKLLKPKPPPKSG